MVGRRNSVVNSVLPELSVKKFVDEVGSTVTYDYSGNSKSREDDAFEKLNNDERIIRWEASASTHFDT